MKTTVLGITKTLLRRPSIPSHSLTNGNWCNKRYYVSCRCCPKQKCLDTLRFFFLRHTPGEKVQWKPTVNLRNNFYKFSLKALVPKVKQDMVKFMSRCWNNLKLPPCIFETSARSKTFLEEPQWFLTKLEITCPWGSVLYLTPSNA